MCVKNIKLTYAHEKLPLLRMCDEAFQLSAHIYHKMNTNYALVVLFDMYKVLKNLFNGYSKSEVLFSLVCVGPGQELKPGFLPSTFLELNHVYVLLEWKPETSFLLAWLIPST